jgi:phosphate transport system permease protein
MKIPAVTPQRENKIAMLMLWTSAGAIILTLCAIIAYVFYRGSHELGIDFLTGRPQNLWLEGGILPAILGTFYTVAVALLFATPLGVGAAVYLTQYTREGKITRIIRIGSDSLNAVPSIVFGLFGLALFLYYLKMKPSVLAAGLTLGFMILPTIIRTAEVAIRSVPRSEIEGSYALGATKLQTIAKVILPTALPGIITGVILGMGRAAGETAPIIWFASFWPPTTPLLPTEPFNSLTTNLYFLTTEAQTERHVSRAFGIASVLLIMILLLNYVTRALNNRLSANIRR